MATAKSSVRELYSYAAPIICGTISGECCECTPLTPGRYATAITLLNTNALPVRIRLNVAPTTLAGATAGRWPASVPFRVEDKIVLDPRRATTIDCCLIARLLLGAEAPANSAATHGIILVETSGLLEVTAIFTTVGAEGTAPSIDVEFIQPRELFLRQGEAPGRRPSTDSQDQPARSAKPAKAKG